MRVAVIGAGSWGTAVAAMLAPRVETVLWARRPELASVIEQTGENPDYLPGHTLPAELTATGDLEQALAGCDLVVMAVPSHGFRDVFSKAAPFIRAGAAVVSLTKGIEQGSLQRMTQIVLEVLDNDLSTVGVLTGPNLATEVAAGQPSATVVAFTDEERAKVLQRLVAGPTFRVYTNPDVVGCEAAGALKNTMAIASGIAYGLGYGDNTIATLITRALAEITRLGIALGGKPLTFAGLAGMGDLIATCISSQSRNHRVGVALGKGKKVDDIVAETKMVAEGVKSTAAILRLAETHDIEMPIAEQVGAVLYEGTDPKDVLPALMAREAKSELHGIE